MNSLAPEVTADRRCVSGDGRALLMFTNQVMVVSVVRLCREFKGLMDEIVQCDLHCLV